jgi:hypothetical protein
MFCDRRTCVGGRRHERRIIQGYSGFPDRNRYLAGPDRWNAARHRVGVSIVRPQRDSLLSGLAQLPRS